MSVLIKGIDKGELPFEARLLLADAATGSELPVSVTGSFLRERGWRVGSIITDGDAEEAVAAARVFECVCAGVRLLAYADNPKRGLVRKLMSRGYDRGDAEAAADELEGLGYINEDAQIKRRGEAMAERKLRGLRRVRADLAAAGYDRDRISAWAEGCGIDFGSICARVIEKKGGIPGRDDPDGRRRLLSYLYRQGFSSSDIGEAVKLLSE